jgi:hypothetical protein
MSEFIFSQGLLLHTLDPKTIASVLTLRPRTGLAYIDLLTSRLPDLPVPALQAALTAFDITSPLLRDFFRTARANERSR